MIKNDELLLKIVKNVDFYVDKNDREIFYAEFSNCEENLEFAMLESSGFKSFLVAKSYESTDGQKTLEPDAAVKKLRFFLNFYKWYKETEVFVRTSGNLNSSFIEYDLQNDKQESVKITADGWKISAKQRKFVVPKIALPQVTPVQTDESPVELLKPFVNLSGDSYLLFVIWLIQSFTVGDHHALLIQAERGSGKTFLSKFIKNC